MVNIHSPTKPSILYKCPKCGKEKLTITDSFLQYCFKCKARMKKQK